MWRKPAGRGADLSRERVEVLNLASPWRRSQLRRLPTGGRLGLVMCDLILPQLIITLQMEVPPGWYHQFVGILQTQRGTTSDVSSIKVERGVRLIHCHIPGA